MPLSLLDQIMERGYAQQRLAPASAECLAALSREASAFFRRPALDKAVFRAGGVDGYDPSRLGTACVESFGYRLSRAPVIPEADVIRSFLGRLDEGRQVMAAVVDGLLWGLRGHYNYMRPLPLDSDSLLLVESFAGAARGEFRQARRVGVGLVTVAWATGDGLEGLTELGPVRFPPVPNAVWLFPGTDLGLMTGGLVRGFPYWVRDVGLVARLGVTFFAGLDASRPVLPFVGNRLTGMGDVRPLMSGRREHDTKP